MNTSEQKTTELHDAARPESYTERLIAKTLAIIIGSIVILFAFSFIVKDTVSDIVETQKEQLSFLKGGRTFWANFEQKLYTLADEGDIDPERKKKVVEALRKLSEKYKPYLQALNGEEVKIETIQTVKPTPIFSDRIQNTPYVDLNTNLTQPSR